MKKPIKIIYINYKIGKIDWEKGNSVMEKNMEYRDVKRAL